MNLQQMLICVCRSLAVRRVCRGAVLAASAGVCATAHAQSIDYRALEQLFGEPVTTSVTGSPQRVSEVPATMEIITAEDIRRSGASDLPGILRHVPGINSLQWGRDNTDLSVRGSNQAVSPRLLVLIDGRQVYADFYGFTPWSALPVELAAIRQIEIVKGPNTALFGFNAVSGVINIITYQPLKDDIDSLSVTAGTQDLRQGSAVTSLQFGEAVGLRLSAGGRSNDDFSTPQKALDVGSRRGNERNHVDARGSFRLDDATELTLEATHSESEQPNMIPTYTAQNEKVRSSSVEGVLSTDSRWGLLQARIYSNSFSMISDLSATVGVPLKFDSDVVVAQLQDLFKVGARHTIRLAVEYRTNVLGTTPVEGGEVFYQDTSVSGMWDWKMGAGLEWTNAVRFDAFDLGRRGYVPPGYGLDNSDWNRRFNEVSFNSGLVWQASDIDTLRVLAARGVQLENLSDVGGSLFALPFGYAGGNPFIEPATVMHYELAWDRRLPITGGRFRVAGFVDSWRDVFTAFGGPPPAASWFSSGTNIGASDSYGMEFAVNGAIGAEWKWGISYAPQIVKDDFGSFVVSRSLIDYEDTTARHVMKANLGWSAGRWEADGFLRYKSSVYGIEGLPTISATLVRIQDYIAVDARVAYRFSDSLSFALAGQNLLQAEQRQTAGPDVERQVFATLTLGF